MKKKPQTPCCDTAKPSAPGAKLRRVTPRSEPVGSDHRKELNRLNRIIGQLEGVKRMVEERRYCPEILTQARAAGSAIRSFETSILEGHLRHCIVEAMTTSDQGDREGKIQELVELFERN